MERSLLLSAVETALSLAGSGDSGGTLRQFAAQAAQEWLASWPGDFRMRRQLAKALAASGDTPHALIHMQQALEADPEDAAAYAGLISLLQQNNRMDLAAEADACRFALNPSNGLTSAPPAWSDLLQSAMGLSRAGRWQETRWAAESALRLQPSFPLPGLIHLKAMIQLADFSTALVTAGDYRKRWPACVAFTLLAAQASFSLDRSTDGVEFLHSGSVMDPASEVTDRYLGSLNPYKPLWPARMDADLSIGIPQAVVIAAGWNRLGSTEEMPAASADTLSADMPALVFPDFDSKNPSAHPTATLPPTPIPGEKYPGPSAHEETSSKRTRKPSAKPQADTLKIETPAEPVLEADPGLEDLRARLQSLMKHLRMRTGSGSKGAGRPAYIVLTSVQKLSAWFGSSATADVEKALRAVAAAKRTDNWSAYLVDVDNAASVSPFGLQPVDAGNAWQVKQLLTGLDAVLQKRGEIIGAVLIVGGHEIIPFHLLPNPASDDDADVPSDNPYATRDENYFVPEWPVGRIPSPRQAGSPYVCALLARAAAASSKNQKTFWGDISLWLQIILRPIANRYQNGSGYSAEIWKNASAEVLREIGSTGAVLTSPPLTSATVPVNSFSLPTYAYFNLHGMANSPEWLGQRSASSTGGSSDFPVALTPAQVGQHGKAPRVVFSEACYGALVLGKEPDTALSLKFLEAGAGAMAGSTRICYGVANAPLIASDLLGKNFLLNCKTGMTCGEALYRAKTSFADEMNKRQGYLDPEDQKTLISFVLYGDPLFLPDANHQKRSKQAPIKRIGRPMKIPLVRAGAGDADSSGPSEAIQRNLKKTMRRYLPGMEDSSMKFWKPQFEPREEPTQPSGKKGRKNIPSRAPTWVMAMEKTVTIQGQSFTHYVRMSIDARGRVIKLAVSK